MNTETQSPCQTGSCARLAEHIARKAHAEQLRRDGVTPYITHPEAVARRLFGESDEVIATAWLHDVLEDTSVTAEILRTSGIPAQVVNAVVRLTKSSEHSYEFYLAGVRENEIARKVKVADMLHNLSDAPTQEQIVKYARGLLALLG
jgi:(p)ppGpp synthase/HD superfamily hydrolase